jgi:hypothetical protein
MKVLGWIITMHEKGVIGLIDFVHIDKLYISCHFKCNIKNKTVVSTVPFEPYDGKIELKWQEMLFHPIKSYNKYYHTPIVIYAKDTNKTIVLKAFKKVSNYFIWDKHLNKYIYN